MIFHKYTKELEKLNSYSLNKKRIVIYNARTNFTVIEKFILNVIKLIILSPPFIFLARLEWLQLVLSMLVSLLIYLIIMKPTNLHFIGKHLALKPSIYKEE